MSDRFLSNGRLKIPANITNVEEDEITDKKLIIASAYCQAGHSMIDNEHTFEGAPGIKIGFRRQNGEVGKFVVSAKLHDVSKVCLKGEIVIGEKVELICPKCGKTLPILADCDRCEDGDMVMIYKNANAVSIDSFAFCNVFGCPNSLLIDSNNIIRAIGRNLNI